MNGLYKYVFTFFIIVIIVLVLWYFQNIVGYILISSVLSLIGAPLVVFLTNIKIGKFKLPKGLSAAITLIVFWIVFIAFFRYFVPLITNEAQKLSAIDPQQVLKALNKQVQQIDAIINQFNTGNPKQFSLIEIFSGKIGSILNIGVFTNLFGIIANAIGNIFIALFSISFITFFFLKDDNLFGESILLLVPTKYEEATLQVLRSTKYLLMRYFVGIGAQITGIFLLVTLGLWIVGIEIKTCLVIALFAGIINVIPYIGPLIGSIFGIILGVASKIQILSTEQFGLLIIFIVIVFVIVHLIDNIIFQPLIFSNSVKAHPLEIFLVILVAGHTAGIVGMLVAIPGYTVVRVFAKQFLNNFKVVKKLTEKI